MKSILKIVRMVFVFLGMCVLATPTYAQTNTDVTAVFFKDGSFKEAGGGMWNEYDAADNIRYRFREVRRDATSVYLREDSLSVDLQIDINRKMISGEWPGSPRRDLYAITTYLLNPLTVTPPPTISPPPPPPPPSVGTPPLPPTTVPSLETMRFISFRYNGGDFTRSGSNWVENAAGGRSYTFKELGHDSRSLYLYDSSRSALVQIDTMDQKIRLSNGGLLKGLYDVTDMAAVSSNPPEVTLRPGTMSPEERRECAAVGGIVERAGILGAERCTKRYNDGGMICTDSSQCQGRCLADTGDANKANITGTCQKTDNPFGCYAEVKNGKSEFALCAD